MPDVVNMADGITPANLNPESVSRYLGQLYEVGRRRAADTLQKTATRGVLFELLA